MLQCTYKVLSLPFFSRYRNFVKYNETDSEIIWKCTDAPPDGILLFIVKKVTPNVPEKMAIVTTTGTSVNFTFIDFQASQPESELFRIPDDCTNVPCRNPLKTRSRLFSKFLEED